MGQWFWFQWIHEIADHGIKRKNDIIKITIVEGLRMKLESIEAI